MINLYQNITFKRGIQLNNTSVEHGKQAYISNRE